MAASGPGIASRRRKLAHLNKGRHPADEATTIVMVASPAPDSSPDPPRLERGAPIGRYLVVGFVGRGAMGEVYAAYDPELDRKVAVKLLHVTGGVQTDIAERKARLLREAQAIARLSHPNVVVVHDVGSFGDRVFVAMEFVDGNTLSYWLHASPRGWRQIVDVFVAAGRGLSAAHAADLVHRDFKGDNVMITGSGQVRVMDFGLARSASSRTGLGGGGGITTVASAADVDTRATMEVPTQIACELGGRLDDSMKRKASFEAGALAIQAGAVATTAPNATMTETGTIAGTPAYMAPEQFRGQVVDARSDQFSFCVALYEALYGERPFLGTSMLDLAENVMRGRLRPPPIARRIPGRIRRAVLRGLANEPAARWPSMDALLAALAHNSSAGGRWSLAAGVAVAGAVIASVALGLVPAGRSICQAGDQRFAGVWERTSSRASRRAAISRSLGAIDSPRALETLDKLTHLLDGYVAGWSNLYRDTCEATNIRGEQSQAVLDLKMGCLRDRLSELRALSDVLVEGNPIVVSNALAAAAALTPVESCAEINSAGSAVARPADATTRQRVEAVRDLLLAIKASQDAGRYGPALDAAVQVVADARAIGYDPLLAEALNRLALLQVDTGHTPQADAAAEEALWLAEGSRYDDLVVELATLEIFVAGYLEHDMARANHWFNQARVFLQRIGGHDLLRAWMLNNMGVALDTNGDSQAGTTMLMKSLQIKERVLGKDHPDVAFTLNNLSDGLNALGRPAEALDLSNRGIEILVRTFGTSHPRLMDQLSNRAEVLNKLGRYDDARQDAERAVAIQASGPGPAVNLIFALAPLGDAELGLGHAARAIAPLRQALQVAEQYGVVDQLSRLRFALGRALWDSGRDRRHGRELALLVADRDGHGGNKAAQTSQTGPAGHAGQPGQAGGAVETDKAARPETTGKVGSAADADPFKRRAEIWLESHR